MRPKQWVKNAFVLAPLIFSGQFVNAPAIYDALLCMFFFCISSYSAYIINDFRDIESDRKHPKKSKTRPLASGQVGKPSAFILLFVLYGILIWGYFQQDDTVLIILAYLLLNLAYTFVLKYQPVIDIFTIAIGFVLRVYAGAVAVSVAASSWILITTLCLALYLAAIKRRQELLKTGTQTRKVLQQYSTALVEKYAQSSAIGAIIFYSMFVLTSREEMVVTIPFVLYGLFRYWFVVDAIDDSESPTDVLFADWQLPATVAVWAGLCIWVIYSAGA